LEASAGNTLELIGIGNDFLNRTQMAQPLSKMIKIWDYMKLKTSAQQKIYSQNCRGCPQNGKKSLSAVYLTRIHNQIYRELKNQAPQKSKTQRRNGQMN
jgi:hypothetical protein